VCLSFVEWNSTTTVVRQALDIKLSPHLYAISCQLTFSGADELTRELWPEDFTVQEISRVGFWINLSNNKNPQGRITAIIVSSSLSTYESK